MENFLSDMKIELEDSRRMLNASEESCRSLNDQNSSIVAEKSALVTMVESISNRLENLEARHTELEDKYLNLERDKDRILDRVKELQNPLQKSKSMKPLCRPVGINWLFLITKLGSCKRKRSLAKKSLKLNIKRLFTPKWKFLS